MKTVSWNVLSLIVFTVASGHRLRDLQQSTERISMSSTGCDPGLDSDCGNAWVGSGADEQCKDQEPPGALWDCPSYLEDGLCLTLSDTDYCALSCGKCCTDKPVPGNADCSAVVSGGLCSSSRIKSNGLCMKSCGVCGSEADVDPRVRKEASILQAFRDSMKDGSPLDDWVGSDPCASWTGVTCSEDGYVQNLDIDGDVEDVSTTIPPQFSELVDLSEMSIYQIGLIGSIPPELSVLDFTFFSTWGNSLIGSFPPELSACKNMDYFGSGNNDIVGEIPVEYSEWVALTFMHVGNNILSGSLPMEFSVLTNLNTLWLSQQADTYASVCVPATLQSQLVSQLSGGDVAEALTFL
eukprot:TRINITY_DN57269_c0_g1_i10.p2 TRINITY_DN57269_c0_g1~~TRINITY_DN57269_c0_g1_i10.p2  ORF type:complete len:352 (+),score=41.36 TRINITY_DN57269_c0_g1_i10:1-1056(+)